MRKRMTAPKSMEADLLGADSNTKTRLQEMIKGEPDDGQPVVLSREAFHAPDRWVLPCACETNVLYLIMHTGP